MEESMNPYSENWLVWGAILLGAAIYIPSIFLFLVKHKQKAEIGAVIGACLILGGVIVATLPIILELLR
jgi:hypothetical protein